tara:strand:+ start:1840 stop:4134 length:2295 start_codon:yes stop_codon:yes gene_type:complete
VSAALFVLFFIKTTVSGQQKVFSPLSKEDIIIGGYFTNEINNSDIQAVIKVLDYNTDKTIGICTVDNKQNYSILLPSAGKYKFIVETPLSEKIHAGLVEIRPQTNLRVLKQEIELISDNGVEKLEIRNLFEQSHENETKIINSIKQALLNSKSQESKIRASKKSPILSLSGKVVDGTGKKLPGVKVLITQDGYIFKETLTKSSGKYPTVDALFGSVYDLIFSKQGFVSKTLRLDTKTGFSNEKTPPITYIEPSIRLYRAIGGLDYSVVEDMPVGIAKIDTNNGYLDYDFNYSKKRKAEIDKFIKEINDSLIKGSGILNEKILTDKKTELIVDSNSIFVHKDSLLKFKRQLLESKDELKSIRLQNQYIQAQIQANELEIANTKLLAQKRSNELKLEKREREVQELKNIKKSAEIQELNKEKEIQTIKLINSNLEIKQKEQLAKKKERELFLLNKEKMLTEENLQKQKNIRNLILSGVGVLILFLVYIFFSLKKSRKSNNIISKQKDDLNKNHLELQKKHKEISDSINYAKTIQTAILPQTKIIKEYLENSFILYKPKDIVAGDFYWMEHFEEKTLFAAADCTGHGVPGAMVSVICNNALNRSVREFRLTNPGDILNNTRKLVIQEFEKSEKDVHDGMDIALCCLEGNRLSYSGANNPLWIIRKSEMIEYKADKQPIGNYRLEKPFSTHEIILEKDDVFYLLSDGYADQFGGDKGKKYKTLNLKKFLLSIHGESMIDQKKILENEFKRWKGKHEQIDDVCIIGVRV